MRLGRIGACVVMAGVYLALRLAVHVVRPGLIDARLAIFLSVAAIMLVQLGLVVSIAGLQMRLRSAGLLAVPSIVIVVAATMALDHKLPVPWAAALSMAHDLFLMLLAATIGYAASFIIREPNIILPAALFAALVDYWNVSRGPLGHMLESKPSVVGAVAVHMPAPAPGVPGTMIGMGDFVFLALFFGVLYRFSMNVKGAFWVGYALLTISMLVVTMYGAAIPALLPMSLAVVGANRRHFKLRREELIATLYVGALLLVFLVASAFITYGH